jgi:hypothetical protein
MDLSLAAALLIALALLAGSFAFWITFVRLK